MKIKKWKKFIESISGWELVGKMGPNYPEQVLHNTITSKETSVICGIDDIIYTYDDYQDLYQDYLKNGGTPLDGFTKINLDTVLTFIENI